MMRHYISHGWSPGLKLSTHEMSTFLKHRKYESIEDQIDNYRLLILKVHEVKEEIWLFCKVYD